MISIVVNQIIGSFGKSNLKSSYFRIHRAFKLQSYQTCHPLIQKENNLKVICIN